MEVANDPMSSAGDLKKILESDAALSARVLRSVNSAAYALRTRITNLQHAISYLGLKQIRNLAMTASVSELFKKDEVIGPYRRIGLWRHLVSVGVAARLIAMRRKLANFEDVFLAGLLHDIGIILEDQHAHRDFTALIRSLDGSKTLVEAERERLGFDHAMLGAEVAARWGFPQAVKAAASYHHASVLYRGEEITTVRCAEVANMLCTLKGIPSVGIKLVRISQPAIQELGLTAEDIKVLVEDLDAELTRNASLFQL
jgi:putative nucleotidyltransferase with HDIG domain